MMGGDDRGEHPAEQRSEGFAGDAGASGGVVAAGPALVADIGLEFRRELADVVQQAGNAPGLRPAELRREIRAESGNTRSMVGVPFPAVLRLTRQGMCKNVSGHRLSATCRTRKVSECLEWCGPIVSMKCEKQQKKLH
jgi:hypothetical protein